MPKPIAVEKALCDLCGADVREGSIFCYNCGGSVSKPAEPAGTVLPSESIEFDRIGSVNGIASPADRGRATRQVGRSDRRRVRASNREPTEIVWEPRTGIAWPFVVSAVVFLVVAIIFVIAAFYLR